MVVSIIIPVYNTASYLKRCLDSVLAQSFIDFEVILVNDGSTDDCGMICDSYAANHDNIRVIHQENRGVSAARNRGMEVAIGDWLTFVDSDDYVKPNYLGTMIASGFRFNSDLVMTGLVKTWCDSGHVDIRYFENLVVKKDKLDLLYEKNILQRQKGPVVKLFKNDIIRKYHLRFDECLSRGEDALFVYSYLLYCNTISVASGANYIYCLREGSLMSQGLASFDTERYGYEKMKSILLQLIAQDCTDHPYPKDFLIYWFERVINSIYSKDNNYDRNTRIMYLEELDYHYYKEWKKPISWKESLFKNTLIKKQFQLFDWIFKHSK
jgi:glycosyltransferase involved in cell wall biosynthesis